MCPLWYFLHWDPIIGASSPTLRVAGRLGETTGADVAVVSLTRMLGDDLRELVRGPEGQHVVGAGDDQAPAAGNTRRDRVRAVGHHRVLPVAADHDGGRPDRATSVPESTGTSERRAELSPRIRRRPRRTIARC